MRAPSVTVVISVKNAKDTIEDCVQSIFRTDYHNKKIHIIDNGSTDGTYEILKKYGKKIKLEKILGPVPKVHNHALKKINTKFVAYTDADCIVDKNWLKNLISGFTSPQIVATAGFCGTPKGVNKLQELIGRELESRWKHFPEKISRAPTMNLCVRTEIAKKVKFDEKFDWAWETDFGYRLTEFGDMIYVPEAVVHHYHRPTWWRFFKQQINNARITPLLYLVKHRNRITGDHISTSNMLITLLIVYLSILFLLLSFFDRIFTAPLFILLGLLVLIFIKDSIKLTKKPTDFFLLIIIFVLRTIAWVVGILLGIFDIIRKGMSK